MLFNDLVATGLNTTQANAYLLLLQYGSITPPVLTKELQTTRTNAYKVLDQLTDLGLVRRKVIKKKYVYFPDNPLSLTSLVSKQRNLATKREEAVKRILNDLLANYHKHTDQPDLRVATGRKAVIEAYYQQIQLLKPLYFLRSQSDISSLSFNIMHQIRSEPARHGVKRYGITPDMGTVTDQKGDKRSNLSRTWVRQEDYSAPVEWSVSGPTLLIILFDTEPHAITITNPIIADAFLQIWKLLHTTLKSMPYYKDLPRSVK